MQITGTTKILLIICLPIGVLFGIWFGTHYPVVGMLALLGIPAYLIWVLISNKQGARIEGAVLADAMTLTPSEGKARLYVVRLGYYGRAQGMNISLSSGHQGQIRGKHFMMAELDPGPVTLTAKLAKQGGKVASTQDVTLAPGESALIEINLEMSMMAVTPLFTEHRERRIMTNHLGQAKMVDWLVKP
jgi:hypothetical protein